MDTEQYKDKNQQNNSDEYKQIFENIRILYSVIIAFILYILIVKILGDGTFAILLGLGTSFVIFKICNSLTATVINGENNSQNKIADNRVLFILSNIIVLFTIIFIINIGSTLNKNNKFKDFEGVYTSECVNNNFSENNNFLTSSTVVIKNSRILKTMALYDKTKNPYCRGNSTLSSIEYEYSLKNLIKYKESIIVETKLSSSSYKINFDNLTPETTSTPELKEWITNQKSTEYTGYITLDIKNNGKYIYINKYDPNLEDSKPSVAEKESSEPFKRQSIFPWSYLLILLCAGYILFLILAKDDEKQIYILQQAYNKLFIQISLPESVIENDTSNTTNTDIKTRFKRRLLNWWSNIGNFMFNDITTNDNNNKKEDIIINSTETPIQNDTNISTVIKDHDDKKVELVTDDTNTSSIQDNVTTIESETKSNTNTNIDTDNDTQNNNSDLKFYNLEDTIELFGYKITNSMFYTCKTKPKLDFFAIDLKSNPNFDNSVVRKLEYYPLYSKLSNTQKAQYIKWLSEGKPYISDIGYVYTYYYGLEYRALEEKKDLKAILFEIIKLIAKFNNLTYGYRFALYLALSTLPTEEYTKTEKETLLKFFKSYKNKFSNTSAYNHIINLLTPSINNEIKFSTNYFLDNKNFLELDDGKRKLLVWYLNKTISEKLVSKLDIVKSNEIYTYASANLFPIDSKSGKVKLLEADYLDRVSADVKYVIKKAIIKDQKLWDEVCNLIKAIPVKVMKFDNSNKPLSELELVAYLPEKLRKDINHKLTLQLNLKNNSSSIRIAEIAKQLDLDIKAVLTREQSFLLANFCKMAGYRIIPDASSGRIYYKYYSVVSVQSLNESHTNTSNSSVTIQKEEPITNIGSKIPYDNMEENDSNDQYRQTYRGSRIPNNIEEENSKPNTSITQITPKKEEQSQSIFDQDKLKELEQEDEDSIEYLSELWSNENTLENKPKQNDKSENTQDTTLDSSLQNLIYNIIEKLEWTRSELSNIARNYKMMLNGAIDKINKWSLDEFGDTLIESDSDKNIYTLNDSIVSLVKNKENKITWKR